MKVQTKGFTLVEIMVVIAIIAILSSIIYANFSQGSAQSRDAKRKADLRLVQNALELYRQDNGRYPAGCNGADVWSGEQGTDYTCAGTNTQYIDGLAPKYLPVLPTDPKPRSGDYGYVYLTNTNGTVYKFVSRKSLEDSKFGGYGGTLQEFQPCEVLTSGGNLTTNNSSLTSLPQEGIVMGNPVYAFGACNRVNIHATCNPAAPNYKPLGTTPFTDCSLGNASTTLAVWGGYGSPADIGGIAVDDKKVECVTERIICDLPAVSGWNN